MSKIIRVVVIMALVVVGVLGQRWYSYISNTESPYQEVGIEINSRLPGPLNKWGCDKLHATFGNVLPPYGCQTADGKSWR